MIIWCILSALYFCCWHTRSRGKSELNMEFCVVDAFVVYLSSRQEATFHAYFYSSSCFKFWRRKRKNKLKKKQIQMPRECCCFFFFSKWNITVWVLNGIMPNIFFILLFISVLSMTLKRQIHDTHIHYAVNVFWCNWKFVTTRFKSN